MSAALIQIESSLLACMILAPRECSDIAVQPEHLLSELNADTLRAYRQMEDAGAAIDALTLSDWMVEQGYPQSAAAHGAKLVAERFLAPSNAPAYARQVLQGWRLRVAADIGTALQVATEQAQVDAAVTRLLELHAEDRRYEHASRDVATAVHAALLEAVTHKGAIPGITTGLRELDSKLGGLHASDLVVVGGRAAMGKTAFLLNLAHAACSAGVPVGIVSAEQPVLQMGQRIVSLRASQSVSAMRSGMITEEAWPRITNAVTSLAGAPAYWYDRSSPSVAEVARVARKWKLKYGIKVLYLDYLQRLADGDGDKRHEKVGANVRALKNLARELEIAVVALSQVSRAVEDRAVKIPRMSDLSDSSEIEKEADQVALLYRPDYYDPNSADAGKLQIVLDKNRHGPTGSVWVAWNAECMRVTDLYQGAA